MYAYVHETGCGFFEGVCERGIGHLLFAIHPLDSRIALDSHWR
jgi:hypothetical protein